MVAEYRLKRATDLESVQAEKKRSTTSRPPANKVVLTEEEKAVMKMLGLKVKDLLALRSVQEDIVEETGNLFEDSTFEEGDDE